MRTKKKRRLKKLKNKQIYKVPEPEYIYNTIYKLQIKNSLIKNSGLGVFALEDIPKNVCIGNYIGDLIDTLYCNSSYAVETYNGKYCIDAFNYPRGILAMINDSKFSNYENNCKFIMKNNNTVEIWSKYYIPNGKELYISYGEDYWKYR